MVRASKKREGEAKKEKRAERSASEETKEREQGGKNIPTRTHTIVEDATNANNQTDRNHKREREDKENNTKLSHTEDTRHEKNKTQTNTTTSNSAYGRSLRDAGLPSLPLNLKNFAVRTWIGL